MAVESFLVTALPYSADPSAPRHLSLFVTHRLTPDGAQGKVGDFPHVRDWTAQLAGATITVSGRAGASTRAIPVTADLTALDATLWPRVFPRSLTVLPWQTPDPASSPWRTFPAHRMQAHSLVAHMASLLSSPVDAPSVAGNVLARTLLTQLYDERLLTVDRLLDLESDGLDQRVSRRLDDLAGVGRLTSGLLDAAGGASSTLLMATDAHLARRYYQRPEEAQAYLPEPTGAPLPPVVQPPPDFHRRASLLGDLSPLLRRLGLIIDVRVDDLSALAGLTEISATIEIPGLANPVPVQPRLSCEVDGSSFTASSASGDYTRGMLRLGDENSFTVLDLDPDASALKLEQYIRNLPRMSASENNGDGGSSAPSTLRATGFAFARNDRAQQLHDQLTDAPARDADLTAGKGPALHLEDVARGVRLEVWDDTSTLWHSLHRRRLSVDINGAGNVLDDAPDTGFLQGASLTRTDGVPNATVNAHEVLAGWDGWSLSAPRPGLTVVHDSGEEKVVPPPDPNPDAANPVASVSTVEPGTLPRLRYGRSYAFRAWSVDLAGNSSPHTVAGPVDAGDAGVSGAPPAPPPPAAVKTATTLAQQRLGAVEPDASRLPGRAAAVSASGIGELRAQLTALRPSPPIGPQPGAGPAAVDADAVQVTGVRSLDRLVVGRRISQPAGPASALSRRTAIVRAVDAAAPQSSAFVERTDTQLAPSVFSAALSAAALAQPALSASALAALLQLLLDVVTTPRPFLRWEPVLEPTVVPRHAYSEAESLLTLVIRSGVEGPGPDGLTMTVVPPEQYVPATLAAHPELDLAWRVDSQRHLVPPKTSQFECELHGLFDAAIGGGTPAQVKAALAAALRESGTLTDTTVADLTTPGARIPQPGVQLITGPTADAPAVTDPADLVRGDGLSRGQYVIHDVDDLAVPYLPDPMADGVSFVFPDGGRGTELTGLLAVEGTHLPYAGAWPDPHPWRLVLGSGAELAADADNSVVRMNLPPGQQLRANLSSSLRPETLDLLGLWRSLPAAIRANPLIAEAAADGWLWWLTPPAQLRLVHAVARPLQAPRITLLEPVRTVGSTSATLFAGVDLHGPSTDRLDVEATWTEPVDDVTKPGPEDVAVTAAVCHTTIQPDEDLAVLADQDQDVPLPDGTIVHVHAALHHFGDTRHRQIDYRMRATTRFAEYFDPHLLPTLDDSSVAGPVHSTNVPSSARPGKPVVRDVLPLLRWHEETEANQPFALSRTRRCGVRIYLERPWFTTGEGELLAVLLRRGADALSGDDVSQWGTDPVFEQQGPAARGTLPLVDVLHMTGLDDRVEAGRPVRPASVESLVDLPGQPAATVLGYQPEYSAERGLWFVDIAVDPGPAFWPFLRLSVARYQPSSLPGLALSPIVKCDFVQLLPPRTALLSRPDAQHARVVVTGPVGIARGFNRDSFEQSVTLSRTMIARLEQRVPSVGTDLGWRTVASAVLPVRGVDATMVSWEGALDLPTAIDPQRPGSNPNWRVIVEEWEALPADRQVAATQQAVLVEPARYGRRIVYADRLAL
jgi:hypothetical protein